MNQTQSHQVIYVEGDESRRWYRLDEGVLRSLLLRPEVAEHPVAVYCIAGAYRTGKSYLLNYCLRYLRAEQKARSDGTWMGPPNEGLSGFDWRSGCDPNTSGILISQPLPLKLPNGEQVCVLLMDTQGTFDRYSSVRDYSTIFALSTILSSVQIYNVKEDIKEDSWQHLQMFTEYGRHAMESGNGGKPFQTLKFLVRDWMHPFNYAFGYEGGRRLLQTNLEVGKEQLQLRQHILASFRKIECYLMPHPGLAVQKEQYDGRHSAAEDNFKTELKNFINNMLTPENITLKKFNDHVVTAKDLFQYFRTFMEIFNSDKMPEIQTVLSASARLALQSAVEAARKLYRDTMEQSCGGDRYVTPERLRERHRAAKHAALALFRARRTMAETALVAEKEDLLNQEFSGWITHYESLNDAKRHRAIAAAKEAYDIAISSVKGDGPICLHPADLLALHSKARRDAITLFDSRREKVDGIDTDKNEIVSDLNKRWNELVNQNESTNKTAVIESCDKYMTLMTNSCGARPCLRPEDLREIHDSTFLRTIEFFMRKRNSYDRPQDADYREDIYKNQLVEKIEKAFYDLNISNEHSCVSVVKDAILIYGDYMKSVVKQCLHPTLFEYEHGLGVDKAMSEYRAKSTLKAPAGGEDKNKQLVLEGINREKSQYLELNDANNRTAISAALKLYCSSIHLVCGTGRAKVDKQQFNEVHNNAVNIATRSFEDKRRSVYVEGLDLSLDRFYDRLMEDIDHQKYQYQVINENNPETPSAMTMLLSKIDGGLLAVGAGFLAGGVLGGVWGLTVEASCMGAGYAAAAASKAWNFFRGSEKTEENRQSEPNEKPPETGE